MATYKEVKEAAKTSAGYQTCDTCGRKRIDPGSEETTCRTCNPPTHTFNPQT
jgi:hypothetical protein